MYTYNCYLRAEIGVVGVVERLYIHTYIHIYIYIYSGDKAHARATAINRYLMCAPTAAAVQSVTSQADGHSKRPVHGDPIPAA